MQTYISKRNRDYSSRLKMEQEELYMRLKEMEHNTDRKLQEFEKVIKNKRYRNDDFSDMEYDSYRKLRNMIDDLESSIERKIKNLTPQSIDYDELVNLLNDKMNHNPSRDNVGDLYRAKAIDISRIVFNILHVIRTPLSGIKISNHSISNNVSDEEIKTKCIQIVQYIQMIEDDLSAFNQIQDIDNDMPVSLSSRLLNETKLLLLTSDKKINLSFDQKTDIIMANTKINSIMLCVSCLIDNAMYYTQDNGTLSVEFSKESEEYKIRITNFGIQIPTEDKDKIFMDGFSTKGSSGLGLGIARKVAETNLKGNLSFINISEPNLGVTFTLSFKEG